MVAFLCFTHTPSVCFGGISHHTITLHIYRVLYVFTWVSKKKKKRLWVLATINFPTAWGALGVTLLKIDWKPQGGSDVARTFWRLVRQLKPGERKSGTLDAQVRSRWDGIFCEGEEGYSGRNVSNKEIWGKERGRGEKIARCLKRNLEGMIYIQD